MIADLIAEKALLKVLAKYINFADVFFPNLAFKLSKHTEINNHTIELVDSEEQYYWPIYNLKLVELKTLKAYIKINLANNLIKLFKLLINTSIVFNCKLDFSSFMLIIKALITS